MQVLDEIEERLPTQGTEALAAVRVEVDGLQVWKRGAVLGQESLQSHLQMRAKLTPERTGELPAAEAR